MTSLCEVIQTEGIFCYMTPTADSKREVGRVATSPCALPSVNSFPNYVECAVQMIRECSLSY
jgi:hypothetical protein